jgi:DNA-directed RNA polymerase specialized sigma24 family protein
MEWTMHAMGQTRLSAFNSMALRYQDEAYTLAYYLIGDEKRAAEATQAAFARLYRRANASLDQFRLEVLRWVISTSRPANAIQVPVTGRAELSQQLLKLNARERSAVVLVDVLGLNYDQASRVLGCSVKETGRLLAQARINICPPAQVQ